MVLVGTEVKSLRARHLHFADAYALIKDGEAFLVGLQIKPYAQGTHANHEPDRTRKLLLNRRELQRLARAIAEKGMSLIPLKLYFKNGRAKVLLGLGRGKSHRDKRETIKRRDAQREMARAVRRG
jgi:SsrA-binding protein